MRNVTIWRLLAGAALTGALSLGAAGVASAAAPVTTPQSGGAAPATGAPSAGAPGTGLLLPCARAPKVLARIDKLEGRAATWLPKAAQREATAKARGRTKLASAIARRIVRVQRLEKRGNTLQQRIEAACPGSSPAS